MIKSKKINKILFETIDLDISIKINYDTIESIKDVINTGVGQLNSFGFGFIYFSQPFFLNNQKPKKSNFNNGLKEKNNNNNNNKYKKEFENELSLLQFYQATK